MTFRKESLAAYERFAFKEPADATAAPFIPGMQFRVEKERPIRPPPPASKQIREPASAAATHLAAVASVDFSNLPQGQRYALRQLVEISENLLRERDAWRALAENLSSEQPQQPEGLEKGKRIEALRRLLARELHPDTAKLSPKEGAIFNALFQRLWPQIDRIAKGQTAL